MEPRLCFKCSLEPQPEVLDVYTCPGPHTAIANDANSPLLRTTNGLFCRYSIACITAQFGRVRIACGWWHQKTVETGQYPLYVQRLIV